MARHQSRCQDDSERLFLRSFALTVIFVNVEDPSDPNHQPFAYICTTNNCEFSCLQETHRGLINN